LAPRTRFSEHPPDGALGINRLMNWFQPSFSNWLDSFPMLLLEIFWCCNQITKVGAPKNKRRPTQVSVNILINPLV
jgi:hypothetical protein